jgi:hypothetical protein
MKKFYHFAGGYIMDDCLINKWIRQCLEAIKNGSPHYSMSSGDTSVIGLVYESEVLVIVANSNGRSSMQFSLSPGYEDPLEFEEYVRPIPVLA